MSLRRVVVLLCVLCVAGVASLSSCDTNCDAACQKISSCKPTCTDECRAEKTDANSLLQCLQAKCRLCDMSDVVIDPASCEKKPTGGYTARQHWRLPTYVESVNGVLPYGCSGEGILLTYVDVPHCNTLRQNAAAGRTNEEKNSGLSTLTWIVMSAGIVSLVVLIVLSISLHKRQLRTKEALENEILKKNYDDASSHEISTFDNRLFPIGGSANVTTTTTTANNSQVSPTDQANVNWTVMHTPTDLPNQSQAL